MKVGKFDITSYLLGEVKGKRDGQGTVVMETDAYTFTDADSDGNVVIAEASEEENNNG